MTTLDQADVARRNAHRTRQELRNVSNPRPGRVDNGARRDVPCVISKRHDPETIFDSKAPHRRPRIDARARLPSGNRIDDDETRIVDGTVPVAEATLQFRHERLPARIDAEIKRARSTQGSARSQMIVEKKSGADQKSRPHARRVRQNEPHRMNDMRSFGEQDLAFRQRFPDEPKLIMFEVPETAVDQLRAC